MMSTIDATEICNCTQWDSALTGVRLCATHHRYHRGSKRLSSVSKVLRGTWPVKPDFSKAPPGVLENARDRGIVVDELFSAYVNGTLDCIPRGTRTDARDLFFKARRWWDDHKHDEPRSQVILADDEIAGTADIVDGDWIYDLKTTYNIEATYPIQLAAYGQLHFATTGRAVKGLGILHLTERFPEPKLIKVDMAEALQDWMTIRTMYALVQKRTSGKGLE